MRRVLRDRYIGAVLVALLLYNVFGALVRALQNPILMWIQRSIQHSALSAGQPWVNKGQLYASLLDAGCYLIVSLLLAWWIYRPDSSVVETKKA
jgi:hypothetical protein